MWFKSNVPIKFPSVWWCAAYMSGTSLRRAFGTLPSSPACLICKGCGNHVPLVQKWQLWTTVGSCMKTAAIPPHYRWCIFPQRTPVTGAWPGTEGLKDCCGLWEKGGWGRIKKKYPKLAASILGGLEAHVACAGVKDTEHNSSCISILCPLYGNPL